jgi:hypothetical protein
MVSGTPVSLKAVNELFAEVLENKKRILEGASSVEHHIDVIVSRHFFPIVSEKSADFDSMILRSDWCSFAAKRKLLGWIVESRNLLDGSDRNKYTKLLRDMMAYRNAFAHGVLSTDGILAFLSYFEGVPRKQELNDDLWRKVETILMDAHAMTLRVAQLAGAMTPPTTVIP